MKFDKNAPTYSDELNQGLKLTGESRNYFINARIRLVKAWLEQRRSSVNKVLDFGCGDGSSAHTLAGIPDVAEYTGTDTAVEAMNVGKTQLEHTQKSIKISFMETSKVADDSFQLAYVNGVFHHIPVEERLMWIKYLAAKLQDGGYLAFWENNPWNPGTRLLHKLVPFDRDAIFVYPSAGIKLIEQAGLTVLRRSYHFIFPGALKPLRFLEPHLEHLPFGGQYCIFAQKQSAT